MRTCLELPVWRHLPLWTRTYYQCSKHFELQIAAEVSLFNPLPYLSLQGRDFHHAMANLATEMQSVAALVDAQVEAGASREEVVDALYRSWIDRFDNCTSKLSNDASTHISMSIKDSPFSPDQKKQLARAFLSTGPAKGRTKAKARANQKCHHIEPHI